MKTYSGQIKKLEPNQIFVFGSNTQGRHGKGAALVARQKFGAEYGKPMGLQGQSWGIVTKDLTKSQHPSIPESDIRWQIMELYKYARQHPELEFWIAYSGEGTNLSGYTPQEMANLFRYRPLPGNIVFEESFAKLVDIQLVT